MSVQPTGSATVLALMSSGFFVAMMDSMIVTTASTAIRHDLDLTLNQLQWTFNAYNVAIAALLLTSTAVGNRLGHRRTYVAGMTLFTLGSVACALSGGPASLVASRVVQGIGASAMTPMSMAILTASFPPARRGRALGVWSGAGGLALLVGPALGGVVVTHLGWQWIFWINVPVGLAVAILSHLRLPESGPLGARPSPVDSTLVVAASGGIVWALSALASRHSGAVPMVVGVVGAALSIVFVLRQRTSSAPLVPLAPFRSPVFGSGLVATLLMYAAMYGIVFFLPQYLQAVTGADAMTAGLELLPWTAERWCWSRPSRAERWTRSGSSASRSPVFSCRSWGMHGSPRPPRRGLPTRRRSCRSSCPESEYP